MENAFQNLLWLIEEASLAWDCDCIVTTRAYLKMAETAAIGLLAHTFDGEEEKRLRTACNYSTSFCLRQKEWGDVVHFMTKFWIGVENGFFERTFVNSGGKYYERGYNIAQRVL